MSVVTATLLSGKSAKKVEGYELVSIDIRRELNRVPHASLVLLDGDATTGEFPLSDSGNFAPGTLIEIKLRYEAEPQSEDATLFKGPILRHGIEAHARGSLLRLEMSDAAFKLTQARKSMVFPPEKTDADVITTLVKDGGLEVGAIAATKASHRQMVQYNSTDWDFIVLRAEANGHWVVAEDGKLSTIDPKKNAPEKKHKFKYGGDAIIYELEMEADARHQLDSVKAVSWNLPEQKPTEPAEAKAFALSQGDIDGKTLAGAVGFKAELLSYPVPLAPEELQASADARMMRSRMSLLRGRLATRGSADIKLLHEVEVDGVGKHFKGKALITGICHRVDVDGWRTDLQFGLPARRFATEHGINDAPAAGLLPAVGGLQIGVVDQFEEDPDKEFRVKVILPAIDAKTGSVWARLAAPDAGKNRGWFFRPEQGDEVVVGFFNDDPRQPVILGSLFGSKNLPPEDFSALSKDNINRVVVTKTGTVLGFVDDKKGSVFIETKGGAKVLLDDSAKSLELIDQNGNEIKMTKDGISLKTAKDLKIEASGNVEIKGAKVDIK